jgi:uncharacterized protein
MNIPLILMSFGVGILIGLTSMGGAALITPFLILIVGVQPVTAVGTDLVYGAVTKVVGAWLHLKQGTVDLAVVRRLAIGSLPGGLLGALVVNLLPKLSQGAQRFEQRAIGAILVLVAIILFARFAGASPRALQPATLAFLEKTGMPLWGAVVGFCVGFTSIGSGALLVPFLLLLYPAKSAKVVGTDVFHAALLVSVTGIARAASGGVEWRLIPLLLAGSIPGVLLGSRLAVHVPARQLRTGLAGVLLLTGIRML